MGDEDSLTRTGSEFGEGVRQAQALRLAQALLANADALSWRLRCFLSKRPEAVTSLTRIFLDWTRLE